MLGGQSDLDGRLLMLASGCVCDFSFWDCGTNWFGRTIQFGMAFRIGWGRTNRFRFFEVAHSFRGL